MQGRNPPIRKALAYCADQAVAPLALLAAERAARLSRPRDFDILICSFEPLTLPDRHRQLGIRNEVIDLHDTIARQDFPRKRLPLTAFLRLWLPTWFSDQYDRLLYHDVDTYPCSDQISRLFEVEMGPHPVAGVRDVRQWYDLDKPVFDFARRSLPGRKFLNSGVMLMDVAQWLDQGVLDRILAFNRTDKNLNLHDQSLINLTLLGQWAELNPVWNWQWTDTNAIFTRRADPQVLHFCGPQKPWLAHVRRSTFPGGMIREYQSILAEMSSDLAFRLGPFGPKRRLPDRIAVETWRQLRHPEILDRLIGRFESPFHTLT